MSGSVDTFLGSNDVNIIRVFTLVRDVDLGRCGQFQVVKFGAALANYEAVVLFWNVNCNISLFIQWNKQSRYNSVMSESTRQEICLQKHLSCSRLSIWTQKFRSTVSIHKTVYTLGTIYTVTAYYRLGIKQRKLELLFSKLIISILKMVPLHL